jgi:hypothetical protein
MPAYADMTMYLFHNLSRRAIHKKAPVRGLFSFVIAANAAIHCNLPRFLIGKPEGLSG